MTTEEMEESETEVRPRTNVPAPARGMGKKNQRGNKWATGRVLAKGSASGTRMVGALDHAQTLVESLVRTAPTSSSARFASTAWTGTKALPLWHVLMAATSFVAFPAYSPDRPAHGS